MTGHVFGPDLLILLAQSDGDEDTTEAKLSAAARWLKWAAAGGACSGLGTNPQKETARSHSSPSAQRPCSPPDTPRELFSE